MTRVEYRLMRQEDIFRFHYKPTNDALFRGLSAWAGRRCIGMGGVAIDREDGRAWGYVLRAPDYAEQLGRGLHRKALRFLAGLKRNGFDAVYATCSDEVPRAAEWLARLGFVETAEVAPDGKIVLRKPL